MTEHQKRRQRLRALKGGSILFYNGAAFDCTVRNLSETGARIEVENPVGIPDKFKLIIKSKKLERACHVMWRKAKEIRGGPGCLNRISASISGASAEVRLPSGEAAA